MRSQHPNDTQSLSSNSEGIEDKNERWLTKFKSPSTQNESGIPIILEPKRGHMKLKEISKLKVSKPPRPQVSEVEAKKKTSKLVDLGDFRQKKEQQDGITFKNNMQGICDILKYYLGEQDPDGTEYCNLTRTCTWWEVDELGRQTSDTNLGDFLIKLPNPDNLPPRYAEVYKALKDQEGTVILTVGQALQHYNDFFQLETNKTHEYVREQLAFVLGFYFLEEEAKLPEEDTRNVHQFLTGYYYYKHIEVMSFAKYNYQLQQNGAIETLEGQLSNHFKKILKAFIEARKKNSSEAEKKFYAMKINIYQELNSILKVPQPFERTSPVLPIIRRAKKISDFLRTFPHFCLALLNYTLKSERPRRLFKGQSLKSNMVDDILMWTNPKCRPTDITTLLRQALLFRLSRRNHLYTRCFMDKSEQHIMLVVKSHEMLLETYAQKNMINLQIDLGATDLFSFEPVDHYLRPLRLHSYVRDQQFIDKYNLDKQKSNPDDYEGIRSIESEVLNIFKKAEGMNADELRAKIVVQQRDADQEYLWVSKKLQLQLPKERVMSNKYNSSQMSRETWELYYVYNKIIVSFIRRARNIYVLHANSKEYLSEVNNNIGMILRLMFVKSLHTCNSLFREFRATKGVLPPVLENFLVSPCKLKTIWNYMNVENPTGFWSYVKTKKYERIWRKFEINESKDRSKFFPSERLIITNRILSECLNISRCIQSGHIIDSYPLHDPFILKNILVTPYLATIRSVVARSKNFQPMQKQINPKAEAEEQAHPVETEGELKKEPKKDQNKQKEDKKKEGQEEGGLGRCELNKLYGLYECVLTKTDFTKMSLVKKLAFDITHPTRFSSDSVRYYCGEKISLYFQFMRFLTIKALPILIIALLIQIFLWAEQIQLLANGSSYLTSFNNGLIFVFTIINLVWTTNVVQKWKIEERKLAQQFGVVDLTENDEKRVQFEGSFRRNFVNDQLNFEYSSKWKVVAKFCLTTILNLTYVLLVGLVILLLFLFRAYLFQTGHTQSLVNTLPSILISLSVQLFSFCYHKILRMICIFQNHKTISDYENSLISKSFAITFVVTFYSIFIYAFFSNYLKSSEICQIKTTSLNTVINNCDYFVSSQLLSFVLIDLVFTVIGALKPFVTFKVSEYYGEVIKAYKLRFAHNFFEPIDEFCEQQDKMESYMYNQQIDSCWESYMSIVKVFTALALFGPALPFFYVMMFVTGVIRMHASKYEIIFLKKRTLPLKAKSINLWLSVIDIVCYLSVVTNVAYMIYTRKVFAANESKIFFFFVIFFFLFKYYLLSYYRPGDDEMAKRNTLKTTALLLSGGKINKPYVAEPVCTDIENVLYDEEILHRKLSPLKPANVKARKGAGQHA